MKRLLLFSLVYLLLALAFFPRWTVDDAYISMRYAHNLVEHNQITWNIGEPVEGYTGVLLVLVYAGSLAMNISPVVAGQSLGVLSLLACGGLIWLLLRELGASKEQQMLGAMLFCIQPYWIVHAYAGLETLLFVALILASFYAYVRRWHIALMALLLLASSTRPEGVALAGVLIIAAWLRGDRWSMIVPALLLYVLPGALYFAWRYDYYGQLLPNTFYAKAQGAGWRDLAYFLINHVLLIWAWLASRPAWRVLRSGGAYADAAFCLILIAAYIRADLLMNYADRFFMPVLAVALVGIVLAFGEIQRVKGLLISYAVLCVVIMGLYAAWCNAYQQMEERDHEAIAAWLLEHASPDAKLAVIVDAGRVPYQTSLHTLDFGALNDVYLAHHTNPADRLAYFFDHAPDYVLLASGDLGIEAARQFRAALLTDPRFQACYASVDLPKQTHSLSYTQTLYKRFTPSDQPFSALQHALCKQ